MKHQKMESLAATDPADQIHILERFKGDGNLRVIVATVAFGMATDIQDI